MSRITSLIDLQDVQHLEDVLRIDWLEKVELTPRGNRRPYFIPDEGKEGVSTLHYRIVYVKRSTIDNVLNLKRVEELSDFPTCPVFLTGFKGELYVRPKPGQQTLLDCRETQTRQ